MREELHGYLLVAKHQKLKIKGTIVDYDSVKKIWHVDIQDEKVVLPLANNIEQYRQNPNKIVGKTFVFRVYSIKGANVKLIHPKLVKSRLKDGKRTPVYNRASNHIKKTFDSLTIGDRISGTVVSYSTLFTIIDYKGLKCKIPSKLYAKTFYENDKLKLRKGEIVDAIVIDKKENMKRPDPRFTVILSANLLEIYMEKEQRDKQFEENANLFTKGEEYPVKVLDFNKKYAIIDAGTEIKSRILCEDLAGGRIPMEDKVFVGKEMDAVFLRYDDGILYFSTKLLAEKPYDEKLFEADTDELLHTLGITANSFTAQVLEHHESKYFYYLYADSVDNRKNDTDGLLLCDSYTGNQLYIKIPKEQERRFKTGCYYTIKVKARDAEARRKLETPYLFTLDADSLTEQPEILENPYQQQVSQTFKKQSSPSQGASLAKLLVEVGDNMYDSKERMFFELLQNADDSSANKGVDVNLESVEGFLILTHDGMPFNRPDFVSITAAARSSKPKTSKKTGYKGIGFKSVFKAYKVYLKTGGFFFKFDSENELYKDFDKFYLTVNDINDEEKKAEFLERFREEKKAFNGIESIPWQLLPEWVDEVPDSLKQTEFSKGENVSIALAMTDATKQEYLNAINDVLSEPKFMLFLRHTNRINYKNGDVCFCLAKDKRGELVSLQSTRPDAPVKQDFIVREADIIEVSTENFAKCGVDIVIKKEYNNRTQKEENLFRNKAEEKIDSIPPRISDSDNTLISYAIQLDENDKYVPLAKGTTLFAYLPMTEPRYPFPIYINADFIMKSSREGVQSENPWNFFLFYNIGREYVRWIAKAASTNQPDYLNLLLPAYFDEETVGMKKLSEFFNRGYKESLHSEVFILNDRAELVRMDQIMIDHTGLSDIIDADEYCYIAEVTDMRLPFHRLNIERLDDRTMFDKIKHIQSLDSNLLSEKNRKYIRNWMTDATKEERVKANNWLIGRKKSNLVKALPLFEFDDRYYAIDEVTSSENLIFLCGELMKLVGVSDKLHLLCCDDDITQHPLYPVFLKDENFEKECTKRAIAKITERTEKYNSRLTIADKALVFSVISGVCKELKCEDIIRKWKLFCNLNGHNIALEDLCQATEDPDGNTLLSDIVISSEEQMAIEGAAKWLMKAECIYSSYIYPQWSKILDKWKAMKANDSSPESSLQHIYYIVQKLYDTAETYNKLRQANGDKNVAVLKNISSYASNPYILSGTDFKTSEEVFFNRALIGDQAGYSVIQKLFECSLPASDCIISFKEQPFKTADKKLSELSLLEGALLTEDEMKSLLTYCLHSKDDFFDHFKVTESDGGYCVSLLAEGEWMFYCSSAELRAHVMECCSNAILLPLSLSCYHTIDGVASTDAIFKKLFESSENNSEKLLEHLRFVLKEPNNVKLDYVSYFETLTIAAEQFKDGSDFTKLFVMFDQLSDEDGFTDDIREKIRIPDADGSEMPLSDISMQGTVSVGNVTFDMGSLFPDDDLTSQNVATSTLTAMRMQGIRNEFLNELFNLDEKISDDEVFNDLNKSCVLKNGKQLAFMMKYCYAHKNANTNFLVKDKLDRNSAAKNSCWVLSDESFIDESCVLSSIYDGFVNYLTEEEKRQQPCGIELYESKSIFGFVKTVLTREEKFALLDSLLSQWDNVHRLLNDSETDSIRTALGVTSPNMILADDQYLLEEEQLPQDLLDWIDKDPVSHAPLVVRELNISDDTCDVIKLRRFLAKDVSAPVIQNLSAQSQQQICSWISTRSLTLSNSEYGFLINLLSPEYISKSVDVESLRKSITESDVLLRFSRFTVYDCHDSIPYYVSLPKNQDYVCHTYQEGYVWIDGTSIFINESCLSMEDGILELTNMNLLDPKDYVEFVKAPKAKPVDAQFEGSMDSDPDENRRKASNELAKKEAKIWLEEHGYSLVNGSGNINCFEVEDKNHKRYPIVVKSAVWKALYINPNEWIELMRPDSRLILYFGHNRIFVITRNDLLKYKELLFLRIRRSNFDENNERLKDNLDNIAKCLNYFERTHLVISKVKESDFSLSNSLDDIGLYKCDPDISGQDNDIDDIL